MKKAVSDFKERYILKEKTMDKKEYSKQLANRLVYMLEENEKSTTIYVKLKKQYENKTQDYWQWYLRLNDQQKDIMDKQGKIFKQSDIQRVRIELNKILIEIEKGI